MHFWSLTGKEGFPGWDGKFRTSGREEYNQWPGKSPASPPPTNTTLVADSMDLSLFVSMQFFRKSHGRIVRETGAKTEFNAK